MSDFEESFQLLSTMSPKVKRTKKTRKQNTSPKKLSLKKHLRRSAVFDKKSYHNLDNSVIIIDESFEDNNQSFTKRKIKIEKSPVVISASSETVSESGSDGFEVKSTNNKFSVVDKWFNDNEKTDGYSEVYSFKHNTFSDEDNLKSDNTQDKLGHVDLSNDDNHKTDLVNSKSIGMMNGEWKVVEIETKNGFEDLKDREIDYTFASTDFLSSTKNVATEKQNVNTSFDDHTEVYESILDELYGKSWREKKDDILPKSEKKPPKPRIDIKLPKTERKPTKIWNNNKVNKKVLPILKRLNTLCDTDTEESDTSSDSYKSLTHKRLNFSESDEDVPMKPPTKPIVKKKNIANTKRRSPKRTSSSSSTSSEINFSESDNDSLGTRVRKRLAKKAKDLQVEFATTPKSKINLKEREINKVTKDIGSEKENKKVKKDSSDKVTKKKTDSKNKNSDKAQKSTNFKQPENVEKNKQFSFLYSLNDCLPSWQSDAQARFYRDNYKTHKEILLKKLFELYNEKIFDNAIPADTPLEWNDRIRQTAGFCYNRRITRRSGVIERHCRIVLAPKILDKACRLRDTLVHEMCHAATWIVNNVADGHGAYWKAWAHKAMTIFPELPPIKRCHDYVINTKYTYKCVDCGYSIGRHSKSLDIERKRCGYCHGKFEIFINKTTKSGETKATPATPKGKATGFALFVKENYSLVKKQDMKHGDVMKLLGQQFAAMKVAKTGS